MRNLRDQIEEQVITPFCRALEQSMEVAQSGRNFAEDTADLIVAAQTNQLQGLSVILSEKRDEIAVQKKLTGELVRLLININMGIFQVRSVAFSRHILYLFQQP